MSTNSLFEQLLTAAPELAASQKIHLLPAGKEVESIHCVDREVHFPTEGLLSTSSHIKVDRRVVSAIVGRQDAWGLIEAVANLPARSPAHVEMDARTIAVPAAALVEVHKRYPAIREMIAAYATRLLIEAETNLACLSHHEVEQRLPRLLLSCASKVRSDHFELTQHQLADIMGCRRTTLSELARPLKASGHLRYSRGRVWIIDREALEAKSCGCPV